MTSKWGNWGNVYALLRSEGSGLGSTISLSLSLSVDIQAPSRSLGGMWVESYTRGTFPQFPHSAVGRLLTPLARRALRMFPQFPQMPLWIAARRRAARARAEVPTEAN
jgi:hypothetical protein